MTASPTAHHSGSHGSSITVQLTINGAAYVWQGEAATPLLTVLRNELGITSPKDGCSGQATCGACLVEIDGKAVLACSTPMSTLEGTEVLTIEGFPAALRRTLAAAFVHRGAVQCGFCTPGFLTRAKILLQTNPNPTRDEVVKAVRPHLCRCTGYQPLVDAILDAAETLRAPEDSGLLTEQHQQAPGIGSSWPKYNGMERALGTKPFVDDLQFPGMLHGALVFSEFPRARILAIHLEAARAMPGVVRIISAADIPGRQTTGMFIKDWPVYVDEGNVTRFRGDVLACVVAETEAQARAAVATVHVDYEELPGLFSPELALEQEDEIEHPIFVEPAAGTNILLDKRILRGPHAGAEFDTDALLAQCAHVVNFDEADFSTPSIEHAFLETEACVAVPRGFEEGHAEFELDDDVPAELFLQTAPHHHHTPQPNPGQEPLLRLYDQGQGIWHDREDIAAVLGVPSKAVAATLAVTLIDAGGGFGGKEDLTVQAHAALAAWLIGRPVKVKLSRPESLRMHPKRHAMRIRCALGCDAAGKLCVAKIRVLADAGAYASVSSAVVTRTGTHATGPYHVPYVDVRVQAVYTNNIPAGAFRGFGVNQSNFAMESTVDMLCAKADFDPWQFRYDNAITETGMLTTGQVPGSSVGIRETLLAVKDAYYAHPRAGLACAVKNAGVGNGVPEPCDCLITVTDEGGLRIDHGWTEMGQGLHTVARQIACEVLNLGTDVPISVHSVTDSGAFAGSTTASRGTFQLGHAVIAAAAMLREALPSPLPHITQNTPCTTRDLLPLAGQIFRGHYDSAGQTTANGPPGKVRNHVSYSFATHVAFLDETGKVERVLAAHDSGQVINRALYESQVTGGVAMGLGYALSEHLDQEHGRLVSDKLRACGLLRSTDMPRIDVIAIEKPDPAGPLGAKGLGEICSIPSTAALINALARFDQGRGGQRCFHLPYRVSRTKK